MGYNKIYSISEVYGNTTGETAGYGKKIELSEDGLTMMVQSNTVLRVYKYDGTNWNIIPFGSNNYLSCTVSSMNGNGLVRSLRLSPEFSIFRLSITSCIKIFNMIYLYKHYERYVVSTLDSSTIRYFMATITNKIFILCILVSFSVFYGMVYFRWMPNK
jgi:hypothetical protein